MRSCWVSWGHRLSSGPISATLPLAGTGRPQRQVLSWVYIFVRVLNFIDPVKIRCALFNLISIWNQNATINNALFSGIIKKRQLITSILITMNTHFSGRSGWTARPGNLGRTNFPSVRLRCEPLAAYHLRGSLGAGFDPPSLHLNDTWNT